MMSSGRKEESWAAEFLEKDERIPGNHETYLVHERMPPDHA
jgi:hypothetical protein